MMNAKLFLDSVIKPVLKELEFESTAAEELLLGTAIQESLNFKYRRQMAGGPARGYFQMEPATHNDIWENYLKYKADLAKKVASFLSSPDADKIEELENNDKYAAAMAGVHYLRNLKRVKQALPAAGDIEAQAACWKKLYNTAKGKGKVSEYIEKWEKWNSYASS